MSITGKQSPLGVNFVGGLLEDCGLMISERTVRYMGSSCNYPSYSPGLVVNNTCLKPLTYAIHEAYIRSNLTEEGFHNLIYIGHKNIISNDRCEALGNSKPDTFMWGTEISRESKAIAKTKKDQPATTGFPVAGQGEFGQECRWNPYYLTNYANGVVQWGYFRLIALQASYEFLWNEWLPGRAHCIYPPEYKDFCGSFMTASNFIDESNKMINTMENSHTFIKYTYSNMDDLISSDITSVSLSTSSFGQDMITSGRAIDLHDIDMFGLPSKLLINLEKNNALTPPLSLALLMNDFIPSEVENISTGKTPASIEQEKKLYEAFTMISGSELSDILIPLNCKTKGLKTLADLLDVKKLFPNSYRSLTVPIYNKKLGLPTNSRTAYMIYMNGSVNMTLNSDNIAGEVGPVLPAGTPRVFSSPKFSTAKLVKNLQKLHEKKVISTKTMERVIKHTRIVRERNNKDRFKRK